MSTIRRSVLVVLFALAASFVPSASAAPSSPLPTGRIAFASDRDPFWPGADIYEVNADGTNLTRVTNFSWWALTPTWSPDGRRIAFTGIRPENIWKDGWRPKAHDIYVMNADGSHITKVTTGKALHVLPSWSPDGTAIAFVQRPSPPTDGHIAVMNPDGSGVTEITRGPNYDFRPMWSPDSSRIVFERDFLDGTVAIYVVNRDGSGLTKLLDVACCPDPAWSPDGTRISFWNSQLPGLQTVDLKTKKVTTLAVAADLGGGETAERWSSWSPDGRWLALGNCCESSDGVDLYLVSADGKTILPVPNAQAATGPAWQPAA